MFDLDHFKRINDTQGHRRGDAVLVEFAAFLRSALGKDETVVRLGGDEFMVVLVAPAHGRLSELEHWYRNHAALSPTAFSMGAAINTPGEPVADTIQKADSRLYRTRERVRRERRGTRALIRRAPSPRPAHDRWPFPAYPAVDAGILQSLRQHGIQQQMIDAQPTVALGMLAEVVPECRSWRRRAPASAHRSSPARSLEGLANLGLEQGIAAPGLGVVDVGIGGNHIEITQQQCRVRQIDQAARMPEGAPSSAACSRTSARAAGCRWAGRGRPR